MFSRVEQIANNSPNVNFLKVDVDQNREAVEEFDVHPEFQNPQLPTFILMKNNQRVGEMFGETNAAKLKDLVEKHGEQILNLIYALVHNYLWVILATFLEKKLKVGVFNNYRTLPF